MDQNRSRTFLSLLKYGWQRQKQSKDKKTPVFCLRFDLREDEWQVFLNGSDSQRAERKRRSSLRIL